MSGLIHSEIAGISVLIHSEIAGTNGADHAYVGVMRMIG
jgi:hypothetical protein